MTRWKIALLLTLLLAPASVKTVVPEPVAKQLGKAEALRARSREYLEAAAAEYRAVLQRDPHNLEAERGLGRVLRDSGAVERALPYLRDAAEQSDDALDYARLGWALFRAGEWKDAERAFGEARRRGKNDAETLRGSALAAAAAGASKARERRREEARRAPAPPPSGWGQAVGTLFNATGVVANTVERLVLGLIALVLAAGVVTRGWGTLMGRAPAAAEPGMRLAQWRGLPVRVIATGRVVGNVRRLLYDPAQARVIGIETGGCWSRHVVPMAAMRGVGPGGLFLEDAGALVRANAAPELQRLARSGAQPLGPGDGRKRVLTEEGDLVGYARPGGLWIDGASGTVMFEVTPSRYHDAWRVAFKVLQFGFIDRLAGHLIDRGLEMLPGRLSARVRLPLELVVSADREVVIVSAETAAWIERHFQELEAEAKARLAQVREGVEKARPHLERVRDISVEKARPHLERVREAGTAGVGLARRSAEAVRSRARTKVAASDEVWEEPRPTPDD